MASFSSKYFDHLPVWVILGAVLGALVGLLFGSNASALAPLGSSYVNLMQVVVFPYIICSLLHALGRLAPATAWRLFRCSWFVYLVLWGLTFLTIFLMSLAIPPAPPPTFLDATSPENQKSLVALLIPTNPFFDLVNNNIPAIVIFSIVYGVAIQQVKDKEAFLSILNLIKLSSVKIWGWIVMFAPIGVFALFADTVGTLDAQTLANLSVYIIAVLAGTLILAFWLLPALVSALLPVTTREILRELQSAFVIAVVTSLSVAALPFIQTATEKLARQIGIEDENSGEIISTTLAVSYPLAQLGNFFIWLFILFAAYYFVIPIDSYDKISLPFISFLSGVGSPSSSIAAVAFLAEWLNMPSTTTELYVEMMSITRYGQVLASVMGFAFISIVVTLNYYGKIRIRLHRSLSALAVGLILIGAMVGGGRLMQDYIGGEVLDKYLTLNLAPDITEGVDAEILDHKDTTAVTGEAVIPTLAHIKESGEIRVGYNAHSIPFSYLNDADHLVGFDIAYAYQLARDLGVKLTLVPFSWKTLIDELNANKFDIAMSGIYVTDTRIQQLEISAPYYQSKLSLIVKANEIDNFLDRELIQSTADLKIGIFEDPLMRAMTESLLPQADIVILPSYNALPDHPGIDAAIWTLEQAKAWAEREPDYAAIVPQNLGGAMPIGYLMPKGATELRTFVDYWLRLQNINGFERRMTEKWLDRKFRSKKTHNPGLIKDLLNRRG